MRSRTVAAAATRRELLGAASLGAAAVMLAGCGDSSHTHTGQTLSDPGRRNDAELLNGLLDLEYQVIAAYTAAIPLLAGRVRKAAQRFLYQELSHAGELGGLIHQAKGRAHPPPPAYDLGAPTEPTGLLKLLHGLEQRELDMKLAAVPQLSLGSTRAAVTAVLGSDAQHLSVLAIALGLDPTPSALPGA